MNISASQNSHLTELVEKISFYPCDIGEYKFISDFVKVPIDRDSIIVNTKAQSYVNFRFFSNFLNCFQKQLTVLKDAGHKIRMLPDYPDNIDIANNFVKLAEESMSWNSEYHLGDLVGSDIDLYKVNYSIYLRIALIPCKEMIDHMVPEIYGALKINARSIEDKKQNRFAEIKTVKLG